ncbi:haloacid dehalogenase type II [Haloactinomyces albus]|uniref:2-haloacid dehalogenase n=1 Tax=Haloactinomyces albus TaxID=1352928 RepID=A0AAE3Z7Q9_9ACTN|nr:haloacid dehalogenase type II [Haloactinomyces albus]MDR7299871.1 2-haloacid dehalogenase [Haloactinomyces albus]
MPQSVRAVVFDVNETLSDMSPLRSRLEEVGVSGHLFATWFAGVLRDGLGLTAAGAYADFQELARADLVALLAATDGVNRDVESAAEHVLDGLSRLAVHPDVAEGVHDLREAGLRLATMTNGSASMTRGLLSRAGLLDSFEALLDVSGPRVWKPAPAAYRYVLDQLEVAPSEALLVAVHPWDIDGARRLGMQAAWLHRGRQVYPSARTPPTHTSEDLRSLAELLRNP